jgi:hypothetical protein
MCPQTKSWQGQKENLQGQEVETQEEKTKQQRLQQRLQQQFNAIGKSVEENKNIIEQYIFYIFFEK